MIPHEAPIPGAAASFADRLAALIPVLDTPRLRLRAPRLGDAAVWQAIFTSDRSVHMDGPYDADHAFNDFCAAMGTWLLRGHGFWLVETRAGEALGFVGIGFEASDPEPELGWFLLERAEGRGYAREAAQAARDWAFGPMQMPGLVSWIDPANTRSIRLAQRLGARIDGSFGHEEIWRHPVPAGRA